MLASRVPHADDETPVTLLALVAGKNRKAYGIQAATPPYPATRRLLVETVSAKPSRLPTRMASAVTHLQSITRLIVMRQRSSLMLTSYLEALTPPVDEPRADDGGGQ